MPPFFETQVFQATLFGSVALLLILCRLQSNLSFYPPTFWAILTLSLGFRVTFMVTLKSTIHISVSIFRSTGFTIKLSPIVFKIWGLWGYKYLNFCPPKIVGPPKSKISSKKPKVILEGSKLFCTQKSKSRSQDFMTA